MKRFVACIALTAVVAFASSVQAASIVGSFSLEQSGATTNALIFPDAYDVYHFNLSSDMDVSGFALDFQGDFINSFASAYTSADSAALPQQLGFDSPDSFFVYPSGTLAGDVTIGGGIDNGTQLRGGLVINGNPTIVPGDGTPTTVAVLSVPEGTVVDESLFVSSEFYGFGLVNGEEVAITFIPEPATFALAGLALCGFGFIRRRR